MKKELKDLNRGEIFKEEVKDAKGSEQKGYRPFMVVSDHSFNTMNGYALVCPLSNKEYSEPDGIEVKTKKSVITGWVLTQHLTPYLSIYINNNDSTVNVVDEAEDDNVEKCLEVFKAISTKTEHKHGEFNQGEIVKLNLYNDQIYAVVLSENSFNECHNSVWVAPIIIKSNYDEEPDHVSLKNEKLFDNESGIVYVEAVRNINVEVRNVEKTNVSLSVSELNKCLDILNIFFE
ncbi:type II toxin-antitoxin system PemK/MazF family toxin [Lysinibacillus fusiformis]|uniref:type II toxin-antitoxin system PemK/MazF family toxin n=1 Tax=Lysinibacillus fusiformis TaxID=28031 RepID=UPI002D779B31|nr:type II toxin-antitoxin system PemK/MazF family toxin [Lysinibacillus fusiformis]WRS97931.1 type II toxin-antitoxin system PemK/MazF family toxin [Lysinibacillus fusiformis]